jgi:hypothetical protein
MEKRTLSKQATSIIGTRCRVVDAQGDALGYTYPPEEGKVTIAVAKEHSVYEGMTSEERVAARKGLICHECGHHIMTNFTAIEKIQKKLPKAEQSIYHFHSNVLDDFALENFASEYAGQTFVDGLRYLIAQTYKKSPRIETYPTPFQQYTAALIQLGDMGIVKGHFTFPQAKHLFNKSAVLFEQGGYEPDGEKRANIALEIFEISRPLWEAEKEIQELMKQLMQDFGKSEMKGEGKGNTPSGTPEETAASKRRKITIKKITKEELDEMKEKGEISEGGSGGDAPDGAEVFVCEDAEGDDSSESSNGIPTGESGEDDGKGSSKSGSSDDYDITVEESEKYKESKKSKKSSEN